METARMLISAWKEQIDQRNLNGLLYLYAEAAEYFDPLFGHINKNGIEKMWHYVFIKRDQFSFSWNDLQDEGDGYYSFQMSSSWQKNEQTVITQNIRCHFEMQDNRIKGMSMAFKMHDYCRQMYGWPGSLFGWNRIYQGRVRLNLLREMNP